MGVYNLTQVNTEPGHVATCPFSPPAGWTGGVDEYFELMRQRYKDKNFDQLIMGTVWCSTKLPMQYAGPFAEQAAQIIHKIRSRLDNSGETSQA